MKKINVIGTTGSGKSTFSRLLAERLQCPYIQMDQLFWKPDWEDSTDEEFFKKVEDAVSGSTWVLDGNYSRTSELKWKFADTIIWIDYSYSRTLIQLFKRTMHRSLTRQELWENTGNIETFTRSFLSRDSILIWFFKNYRKNKRRYEELMGSGRVSDIEFIRLCSPTEVKRFIEDIDCQ